MARAGWWAGGRGGWRRGTNSIKARGTFESEPALICPTGVPRRHAPANGLVRLESGGVFEVAKRWGVGSRCDVRIAEGDPA